MLSSLIAIGRAVLTVAGGHFTIQPSLEPELKFHDRGIPERSARDIARR